MSFATRLNLAVRAFMNYGAVPPQAASGLLWGVAQGDPPMRNAQAYLEAYNSMPWLRATTHRIAESVAAVRWHVYAVKRQGRYRRMDTFRREAPEVRQKMLKELRLSQELEEIEETPLLRVLYSPNPFLVGSSVRTLTQIYLDILGEAFWLKERRGRIVETVWPIPPTWVRETPSPSKPSYEVSFRGWQGNIPDTEMIWFKQANLVNPYTRGQGVVQALADELDIDESAAKYTRAFFHNSAIPPVVVSPESPTEWSDTARQQMKASWLNEHQGFWKSFKVMFSRSALKIHQLSHTFQEQQLGELRQQQRDTIVQVLSIPPEIVGIISNSNRATIDSSDYLFARYALQPRLEYLREALQDWLVPEYDARLLIDYDNPVPEDKAYLLEVAKAQPQALSQNEWRELLGKDPVPHGEVHHVPNTVTPMARLDEPPPPPQPPMIPAPANGNGTRPRRHMDAQLLREAPLLLKAPDEEPDAEFYALVHHIAERLQPQFRRQWMAIVEDAKQTLDLDVLATALRGGLSTAVEAVIPWTAMVDAWRAAASETFQHAVTQTGIGTIAEVSSVVGQTIAFGTASPRIAEFALRHAATFVTLIEPPSREAIRQAVSRAFTESRTAQQVAREIRDVIGLLPRQESAVAAFRHRLLSEGVDLEAVTRRSERLAQAYLRQRSLTIAQTEMLESAREGQEQAWFQAVSEGVLDTGRARFFWVLGPEPCPEICEGIPYMNPDGRRFNEPFQTPAGPKLRPGMHVRCMCVKVLRFISA